MESLMETFEEKLARVLKEKIEVVSYDSRWPGIFEQERRHLLSCLPIELIRRIEHFGSTAVPGISAKPIVDILVEVTSLDETRKQIAPILEAQGYDYFWRPSWGDDTPPFYAWFIKRDKNGNRTHHIHMPEVYLKMIKIEKPAIIQAAGNKPKVIEEFIGRVNSETDDVSVARMKSPAGWIEPGQTPDFNEYTVVP
jgi:GrpB-like predicted nucleotidyltransferase (UPF0157 family)